MKAKEQASITSFIEEYWPEWVSKKYFLPLEFRIYANKWFNGELPSKHNISKILSLYARERGYFYHTRVRAWVNGYYDYYIIFTKKESRTFDDVFPTSIPKAKLTESEKWNRREAKKLAKHYKEIGI